MKTEEFFSLQIPDDFTILVTWDDENWHDMGWYISIEKLLGSKKNSVYPPQWSKYKDIKIVKRTCVTKIEDVTEEYRNILEKLKRI